MESVRDFEIVDEDTLDAALRRRNDFCAGLLMFCVVEIGVMHLYEALASSTAAIAPHPNPLPACGEKVAAAG
ncbi:hypothetical protein [Sinorhizobium terangae]|uniref:hypothetical protein n=1 Tax=Sinorhizobium terangae TaxID=110322 RepID=UPI0024B18BA7|nr:hypothetical protein [Sinorhizobium terangae]WFU47435.1 hypothetical protein QA637_16465 [Sinorhizobium terangae]